MSQSDNVGEVIGGTERTIIDAEVKRSGGW
jgi:hypothetical protein